MNSDCDPTALPQAIHLLQLVLQSPEDLVVRCRHLLGVLSQLGVAADSNEERMLECISSEADRWPIGVDPSLLEPAYHQRCIQEVRAFEAQSWQDARLACESLLELLSARLDEE